MNFGHRVILRFILDQKNAESTLNHIQALFHFGKVSLRKDTQQVYRYQVNSYKGLQGVSSYFQEFSLKTKKRVSFIRWNKIYGIVLKKEHLTSNGIDLIKHAAKEINITNIQILPIGNAMKMKR